MCAIIIALFKRGSIVEREQETMFERVLRKKGKGRNFITKF